MSNNVSQFSEIRTPSSYPLSEKRYFDSSRAGLRVPIAIRRREVKCD
jgi:hypothetical protein